LILGFMPRPAELPPLYPRQAEVFQRLAQFGTHGPTPAAAGWGALLVLEEQIDAGGFGQRVDARGRVDAAAETAQHAAQLLRRAAGRFGQRRELQTIFARLVERLVDGALRGRDAVAAQHAMDEPRGRGTFLVVRAATLDTVIAKSTAA